MKVNVSTPSKTENRQDLWNTDILQELLEHRWQTIHQFLHEADCLDIDNWTILHWSCREHYTPLDTIKLLLNAHPQSALYQDLNGCTPLHIALIHSRSLEVIELLVESYPRSLRMVDINGKTPLHIACSSASKTPLQIIEFLVKKYPEAALQKDINGKTPLIEIICHDLGDEVIELLLRCCPDCASTTDDRTSYTPLHLSVNRNRSVRIMKALIKHNPNLISSLSEKNQTAEELFYHNWNYALTKLLESISSSTNPSDIRNRNVNNFSIHYLHDVACFFLSQNSASMKDEMLHSAIQSQQCPWSFCELFLRLYPYQLLTHNSQGFTPIELMPNSSKRKFYEPHLLQRARIIYQLRKNCNDSAKQKTLIRFLQHAKKSNDEELKMINLLYSSIRDNPMICSIKKRRLV